MTNQEKTFMVINRILVFTPFTVTMFISFMLMFIRVTINFIKHGGESIVYTRKNTRKTIFDIYVKLEKEYENNKG